VITVMSARADALKDEGVSVALATLDGMRLAFIVGAVLSVAVVVTALLLPAKPDNSGEHGESGSAHPA
jgi:DHA2 family lincomycin resistance protein-like MFS transporter